MISIRFQTSGISGITGGAWKRVLDRFAKKGGDLLVEEVHKLLGTDALYSLNPEYAERKQRAKGFRRYPGKSAAQPLIFSGEFYEAIVARFEDGAIVVTIDEGKAEADGFDYASYWEDKTALFQQALDNIEPQLDELLLDIAFEELGL